MNYVIGSGLSALSFCYFNKKKNSLFESDARVGGRIQSQKCSSNFIEGGAQFYSKEDPNIYGLIKSLDLEKEETKVSLSKFFVKKDERFISISNSKSKQLSLEESKQIKLFNNEILKTLKLVDDLPENLIETSFDKWYVDNIGKETVWLINGMIRAITFTEPKNQSALYGIIVCGTFFSNCYSIKGGLEKINEKLINLCKPEINTNSEVTQINFCGDCAKNIDVNEKSLKIPENLISAIPSNSLSKITSDKELSETLGKITYNGCAVLILELDKKVLNHNSGILYSDQSDSVAVMIDEPKYYNFQSKEYVLGLLFPYKERPSESFMLKKANEKIREVANQEFKILNKKIFYWDYGLPEFNKKNALIQNKIGEITSKYKNFSICGDFMGLPSLDACVESARKAAQKFC